MPAVNLMDGSGAWRRWGVAAALLLGGCAGPYDTLRTAGAHAGALAGLGLWLCGLMLLITAAMTVLLLWGALRRRGTLAERLPLDADGGKGWILIGGVLLPACVLTALLIATLVTLRQLGDGDEPVELELRVTAQRWWWKAEYLAGDGGPAPFVVANEIHVPVGKRVGIRLVAADVIHSFWVPQLHGKLDMIPGQENYLVLEAERPGIYPGQCAEFCGGQHAHMHFLVVAQEPEAFAAWAARQRQPAMEPATAELRRGRAAFEQACSECHTVRGTAADGDKAPDLTHIGSRRMLGAGILPNDRGHLQGWIADAQAIKPGIEMPVLDRFDGATLNALAAYLESLQ